MSPTSSTIVTTSATYVAAANSTYFPKGIQRSFSTFENWKHFRELFHYLWKYRVFFFLFSPLFCFLVNETGDGIAAIYIVQDIISCIRQQNARTCCNFHVVQSC
jgi:hypothetical protein